MTNLKRFAWFLGGASLATLLAILFTGIRSTPEAIGLFLIVMAAGIGFALMLTFLVIGVWVSVCALKEGFDGYEEKIRNGWKLRWPSRETVR